MEEKLITIPVEEYKELLKMSARVELFAEFVNREGSLIYRKDCGKFFGFEVVKDED